MEFIYRHTLFLWCFSLLCFTDIAFPANWKLWQLVWSKSVGTVFPTALAHFMSLPYVWHPCNISDFFIITIFFMVIHDEWSLILLLQLFQGPTNHSCIRGELNWLMLLCSDCSTARLFSCLTLSPSLIIPGDTVVLKLGQLIGI